ncbi:MAG: DNA-processing protein DprA [Oscillospiraceae bacterium]
MKQEALWIWMQKSFGIGTRRAHEVMEYYDGPEKLLSIPPARLVSDGFLTERERKSCRSPDLASAEQVLLCSQQSGAWVLTPDSKDYPEQLRNIHSMPMVLHGMGDVSLLTGHTLITMVGTRMPDEYGTMAADHLSREIASTGAVVVSGLAVGLDAVCHAGALAVGGTTLAVVAGGLDLDYPRPNHALRKTIEERGLLLSEFPPGTQAYPQNFGMRNRILSGLSLATVVIQATIRSGTMLTAAHALSQNRDVFAVPGSIFSLKMEGCHTLLSEGAAPALSGIEVVRRYHPIKEAVAAPIGKNTPGHADTFTGITAKVVPNVIPDYLSTRQAAVLECLLKGEAPVGALCEQLGGPVGEILATLTQLELFGLAEALPGHRFGALRHTTQ